jgi:hypothetical protein
MKILICGDSFAADWTVKYSGIGWPNLLAKEFNITNVAQAGCSEYKIYKQLIQQPLDEYDIVIVSHTSAFRWYIEVPHPVHGNDPLHKNSDLIFADVEEHSKTKSGLKSILEFFSNYFSIEYAEFVHELICSKIHDTLKGKKVIHITNINNNSNVNFEMINFHNVFLQNRGLLNHFTEEGNRIVFERIKEEILKL